MHRIQCSEIWGGIRNQEQDVRSSGVVASLYSSACNGGKGGDIYYLSVCDSDLLTRVAIADVVGHGEAVSDVSQVIYDALKTHMNNGAGNELMNDVNRIAVERGFSAMTTAALVAFYKIDNVLLFTYAGHHPILVKRRQDRHWFEAPSEEPKDADLANRANLPLAVLDDPVFTQQAIPLTAGDRIFLYTDGVIEAPDHEHNLFGTDRLKAVLEDKGDGPLQTLRTGVLDALHEHSGGDLSHDDVTLLAVEIC